MTADAARFPRRSLVGSDVLAAELVRELVGVLSTAEDGVVQAIPLRSSEDGDTREE